MSGRGLIASLLVALATVVAGCGSSESTLSDREILAEALLTEQSLPNGGAVGAAPSEEQCNPIPILESHGGRTRSRWFVKFEGTLHEAVGVFRETGDAEAAYRALNAKERVECVRRVVHSLGSPGNSETIQSSRSLDVDAENSLIRVLGEARIEPGTDSRDYMDVLSIRSGRCIAVLTLVHRLSVPSDGFISRGGRSAAQLLAGACR